MKLTKAIEILTDIKDEDPGLSAFDDQDALKLGIEALKREKEHQELDIDTRFGLLPGQTPE